MHSQVTPVGDSVSSLHADTRHLGLSPPRPLTMSWRPRPVQLPGPESLPGGGGEAGCRPPCLRQRLMRAGEPPQLPRPRAGGRVPSCLGGTLRGQKGKSVCKVQQPRTQGPNRTPGPGFSPEAQLSWELASGFFLKAGPPPPPAVTARPGSEEDTPRGSS